jgi:hypothetical protein
MLLMNFIRVSALAIRSLCAFIQLVSVSILVQPMTGFHNQPSDFSPDSFCSSTSSMTSLASTTTRTNHIAAVTDAARYPRAISNICYSLRHSRGNSFKTIYNGCNYQLFLPTWCLLPAAVNHIYVNG